MKRLVMLALLMGWPVILFSLPSDTAKYKWIKGEKFLLHKVAAKETWTGIARKYNVEMEDVIRANPGILDLKMGQIIKIPVKPAGQATQAAAMSPSSIPSENPGQVTHKVKTGETLFSISRKYQVSIEELKRWNHLDSDQVKEGQTLIVGQSSSPALSKKPESQVMQPAPASSASPAEKKTSSPAVSDNRQEASAMVKPVINATEKNKAGKPLPSPEIHVKEISKSGNKILSQVNESGICTWISDPIEKGSGFFALHRTAPAGTIIKVTSKMNGRSVFVKVVGPLPDTGDNEKVIIKISEAAAQRLLALDRYFQVELSYGVLR
jgi:LysM repeat protein